MADTKAQKQWLRQSIRRQQAALSESYKTSSSKAIAKFMMQQEAWRRAQVVFLYMSMKSEVGTEELIKTAHMQGKTVCLPRCVENRQMQARLVTPESRLRPAAFGILEPGEDTPLLQPQEIELVVAPCVAVDKAGNRLGNGAGYYDRFLQRTNAVVACLCRQAFLQQSLPSDSWDYTVDMVVTEAGIWPKR